MTKSDIYLNRKVILRELSLRNITQKEFAYKIGIHKQYLCMLLNPQKYRLSPSPKLREKILSLLKGLFTDIFIIVNLDSKKKKEKPRRRDYIREKVLK